MIQNNVIMSREGKRVDIGLKPFKIREREGGGGVGGTRTYMYHDRMSGKHKVKFTVVNVYH